MYEEHNDFEASDAIGSQILLKKQLHFRCLRPSSVFVYHCAYCEFSDMVFEVF